MAINKDSNSYTISFAIVLVVIVGGLLAMIANGLKPIQDENLMNEKKYSLLHIFEDEWIDKKEIIKSNSKNG